MKKKITAIALAVCIIAVGIVGATMSYFTDTDEKTNTFTFGKVDINLTETSTASDGVKAGKAYDSKGNVEGVNSSYDPKEFAGYKYDTVLPGDVFSKVPTVTVDAKSMPAFVAATASVPAAYDWDGLFNGTVDEEHFDKVRRVEGANVVYYFYAKSAVAAGASVTPFRQVKVNPALDSSVAGESFNVVVNAYAVQSEGFSDATTAVKEAFGIPADL